jgi:uncharacterized protein involved in exopolysaccharide biosynthesis
MYSDGNVRIRSLKARILTLQNQLSQIEVAEAGENQEQRTTPSLLPTSVRNLPQLQASFTDLARKAKFEEAIYELLTQQYELAKVQEAKETPSVKILDRADIPEQKSFPPRALITLFGGLLGLSFASFYVLAVDAWRESGSTPTKAVAGELFRDVRTKLTVIAQAMPGIKHLARNISRRWRCHSTGPGAGAA